MPLTQARRHMRVAGAALTRGDGVARRARERDVGRTVPGEVVQVDCAGRAVVAADLDADLRDGCALRVRHAPGEGVAVAGGKLDGG